MHGDERPPEDSGADAGSNPDSDASPSGPVTPQRAASVALRRGGAAAVETGDDAGSDALLDALRITYRVLVGAMVLLGGLYVMSGFETVREGERAVRTQFGAAAGEDLGPGFQLSWPYPFGELVRVDTSRPPITLGGAFWPVPESAADTSLDALPVRNSLEPGREGLLITSDGNIAHARFSVVYRREDLQRYVQNVYPPDEEQIVTAAVRRGVVRAVAGVDIDTLLKQGGGDAGSVEERARRIAQGMLDTGETGLVIERLTLVDTVPPGRLRSDFNSVQAAQAAAATRTSDAEREAQALLNATAGPAVEVLSDLIGRYGSALELGDADGAAALLNDINRVLEREPIEYDGRTLALTASGRVTQILNTAERDATGTVSAARSAVESFRAFEAQYAANPEQTVRSLIGDATTAFLGRDFVQTMWFPPGALENLRLRINRDPLLTQEQDRAVKAREAAEALERRNTERMNERFLTEQRRRLNAEPGGS